MMQMTRAGTLAPHGLRRIMQSPPPVTILGFGFRQRYGNAAPTALDCGKIDLSRGSREAACGARAAGSDDPAGPRDPPDSADSLSAAVAAASLAGIPHCSTPDVGNTADRCKTSLHTRPNGRTT